MKLCAKFERNQENRGRVTAIAIFNLMTLNMCYVLRSVLGQFAQSLTFDNLSVLEL